jgi:predicted metal-dependent hydrolase
MSETLTIGALTFALRRSAQRKTLGLTIERDGTLTLSAPVACPEEVIERFARARATWVYTRLAEKELLARPQRQKEFVSGEGFAYLGRHYRLLLVAPDTGSVPALRLHNGRFCLRRDARDEARVHFIQWYSAHALPWLQARLPRFTTRLELSLPVLRVCDLGYRWGSCSEQGTLNFHWRTILLPPAIIEYIVVHELVHLHEPHHNGTFWQRLARVLPDYEARKGWLAEQGGSYFL